MKQTKFKLLSILLPTLILFAGCSPKNQPPDKWYDKEDVVIKGGVKDIGTAVLINKVTVKTDKVTISTADGKFSLILEPDTHNNIKVIAPNYVAVENEIRPEWCLYGYEFFLEPSSTLSVSLKKVYGVVNRMVNGTPQPYPGVDVMCEGQNATTDNNGQFRITGINDPTPSIQFSVPDCYINIEYMTEIRDSSALHVVLR